MNGLTGLVPEAYYDFIARVPPGVVLLALLASDHAFMQTPLTPRDLNASTLVALLLFGYMVGIILGSLGGSKLSTREWVSQWQELERTDPTLTKQLGEFDAPGRSYEDKLALMHEKLCDEVHRGLLTKLAAEVNLCANLVVAFAALLLLHLPHWFTTSFDWQAFALILGGIALSLIALRTRQQNATRRQKTLLRARVTETAQQ